MAKNDVDDSSCGRGDVETFTWAVSIEMMEEMRTSKNEIHRGGGRLQQLRSSNVIDRGGKLCDGCNNVLGGERCAHVTTIVMAVVPGGDVEALF